MEPSVEASPLSLPHRRSHLPSRTFRSLVRLCSDFHGENRVSLETPTVLRGLLLRSDNVADDEAAQVSRKEACEPKENFQPEDTRPETLGMLESEISEQEFAAPNFCTGGGPGELQIVLDDRERAGKEKVDNANQEKNLMLGDVFDATDLQDGMVDLQQMLMDELELMINGNEDPVPENCVNPQETSLVINHSGVSRAALVDDNDKQQYEPVENDVGKPRIAAELQAGQKECDQKTSSESIDLSLDKGVVQEVSKSADSKEGRSSGETKNYEEKQLKGVEQEKSLTSTCGLAASVTQMLEDENIEEGEIFGDLDIVFDYLPLGNGVPIERMDGKQVSERETASGLINHTSKESFRSSPLSKVVPSPEFVEGNKGRESENKFGAVAAYSANQVMQQAAEQDKLENNAIEGHATLSAEKLNAGSCGKKKSASYERKRKEKKKERYRKKRAEKNRLLGVKRLKLKQVVKPKPVRYCQHYLKGRCHEGEKCRFSHDTVPLTKSLPCCYFATQSCMKGDDCPFDHDLSKYPCTNFSTKGFCNRGDNCLFSHKCSSQSALDASKSETAPSTTFPVSHSKEKPNTRGASPNNVPAASFSFGVLPQKTNKKTMAETIKPPSMYMARVRSPLASAKPSIQPNHGSSSSKINERGKSEIPIRRPPEAPKGIKFLSFNKTSPEDGPKRLSSVGDAKAYPHEQASSSTVEDLSKVRYEKTTAAQRTLSTNQNSNEMLKRSSLHPPTVPNTLQTSSEQRASAQTQKTLISALKLAAEFESERMKRPTNVTGAVNKCDSMRTNVAGSSRNSSKILEFLSSFGSSKQSQ